MNKDIQEAKDNREITMKLIIILFTALFASIAYAKTPKVISIESAGIGNTNVSVGNDLELLSNPALMEFRGSRLSIPGLNLYVSDPREIEASVNRYKDFFNMLDAKDAETAGKVREFIDNERRQSFSAGISLLPSFQLSTPIGTFGIGGFGLSENKIVLNPNSLEGLAELYDAANNQTLPSSNELEVNKPFDVISVSDAGAIVGYAKKFKTFSLVDVSVGLAFRGFERVVIDFVPSTKFKLDGGEIKQENIQSLDDVKDVKVDAPKLNGDFTADDVVARGRGYAFDGGVALRWKFVTVGIALRNIWANEIQYSNDTVVRDHLQYNFGVSAKPLWFLPVLDGLIAASEIHTLGKKITYHAGAEWKLGYVVYVIPRVGYENGYIDPRGNFNEQNKLDVGLTLDLIAMRLTGLYSYDSENKSQFGAALTFGYEWEK